MNSSTKSEGDMVSQSPRLRLPVFCPLCGSPHRFYTSFAEQAFLIGRLVYLQRGYTCSTEDVSLAIPGTSNCTVQRSQHTQAQQPSQSAELPLTCPRAVLVNVLEFLGSSAHQIDQRSLAAFEIPRNNCNTRPYDDNPVQAQFPARNNPNPSKASSEHLDEFSTFADHNRRRRDPMPAEGNIRRLSLGPRTSPLPNRRRSESLPAHRNDWDEYQDRVYWGGFSSNASRCGSPAESRMVDDDDADEVVSVDSERTVTPSLLVNRATGPLVQVASVAGPAREASPASAARATAIALAKIDRMIEEAKAREAAEGLGEMQD